MIDHILHVLALALLRVCSPLKAYRLLRSVGWFLRPLCDRSALLRAEGHVRRRGTCLSRALAVAARAPHAEIVIGVESRCGEPLRAHAWLEVSGQPLDGSDVVWAEIARIRPAGGLPPGSVAR